MTTETKKPLVVYHDNCADGFGAAWAAYKKFGADGAEYLPMNYNDKRVELHDEHLSFPVALAGRDVYILDFSFKPEVIDAMLKVTNYVTWIDHHLTAFKDFNFDPTPTQRVDHVDQDLNWDVILDPNKSGCVLAWEHFHPNDDIPNLLRYIEDRDLWRWKYTSTRDLATGLRSKPFTFEWFDFANENLSEVMNKGTAMNELFDQQLADITKYPVPTSLYAVEGSCGRFGMSVNCTPQFASEAGNVLAQLSGTFGMTWCAGDEGQVFVSLRSIGDYDVSVIAKAYGGGGHKNAAGFKTSFDKLGYNGDGELEIRV